MQNENKNIYERLSNLELENKRDKFRSILQDINRIFSLEKNKKLSQSTKNFVINNRYERNFSSHGIPYNISNEEKKFKINKFKNNKEFESIYDSMGYTKFIQKEIIDVIANDLQNHLR